MDNNYNMYDNSNNGNMYDAPKKMDKKKKIELAVLIFLIIWGVIFTVNYVLYTKSEKPIFMLPLKHKYSDGEVKEYLGIGYVYRIYDRTSIKTEEFVPFWKPLQKAQAQDNGLPLLESDYPVPDNFEHLDKYKSLIYFYVKGDLIGTYKCINSSNGCNKAFSGYDKYNIRNTDPLYRMEKQPVIDSYNDRFGFIDDSTEQSVEYGSPQYNRIIYILDIENNKLLARYADIKYQYIDEFEVPRIADNGDIVVRSDKNKKWGIVNLSKNGEIKEVLPFEYESVNYDIDTGYYILMKDDKWFVYNLKKNIKVSEDFDEVIYDVWENSNMTYYVKTGYKNTIGEETFMNYKVYTVDGNALLTKAGLSNMYETDKWIMYLDRADKRLHFIDYSGDEKIILGTLPIQLRFTEMEHDKKTNPAFKMNLSENGYMRIYVYNGRSINEDYVEVSFSTITWE